ncbi:unnamed protein product, partial [Mesorhabditis belari]|uniref:Uncharacterized protein n=1 Tax=Mesorhabditis belari TaxID=2138241 RepID=A0AAF3EL07_9BILA
MGKSSLLLFIVLINDILNITACPTNLTTTTTPPIFVSDRARECWRECQESTDEMNIFNLCTYNFVLEETFVNPYYSCTFRHPECEEACHNCLGPGNSICVISSRVSKFFDYVCDCEQMCECPESCKKRGICITDHDRCLCKPDH